MQITVIYRFLGCSSCSLSPDSCLASKCLPQVNAPSEPIHSIIIALESRNEDVDSSNFQVPSSCRYIHFKWLKFSLQYLTRLGCFGGVQVSSAFVMDVLPKAHARVPLVQGHVRSNLGPPIGSIPHGTTCSIDT